MSLLKCSLEGLNQWILDGFPRTLSQAKSLDTFLPPDLAICIQVPESIILERVSNRWIHLASGRTYNDSFNKPKKEGYDDVTDEPLVRRIDDQTVLCDGFLFNTRL
jgi:adenylate kinase family enzyme